MRTHRSMRCSTTSPPGHWLPVRTPRSSPPQKNTNVPPGGWPRPVTGRSSNCPTVTSPNVSATDRCPTSCPTTCASPNRSAGNGRWRSSPNSTRPPENSCHRAAPPWPRQPRKDSSDRDTSTLSWRSSRRSPPPSTTTSNSPPRPHWVNSPATTRPPRSPPSACGCWRIWTPTVISPTTPTAPDNATCGSTGRTFRRCRN